MKILKTNNRGEKKRLKQIQISRQKTTPNDTTITVKELIAQHSANISSNNALALVTIGNETHALRLNEMVPTSAELLLDEENNVIQLQPMQGA